MKYTVIIPSRYASSRLPAKPLLDIAGKPMVQHVYERAKQSRAADVIVATDHQEIFERCESFGAKVVMTKESHESGTDRLQEVVEQLGLADDEVIVNVQGDEPLIPAAVIDQTAQLLSDDAISMATLYESIATSEHLFDPNVVKLVSTELASGFQQALYFSRAPIAWARDTFDINKGADNPMESAIQYKRHIGIYAYRVGLLHQFVTWPMAKLEAVEKLEQLRVLANGYSINVAEACETIPAGVDTQADLDAVREYLARN